MTTQRPWAEKLSGEGCRICPPRPARDGDKVEVARLGVSTLYLKRDQRFRGYCVLIFDPRHATDLPELTDAEYFDFMWESWSLGVTDGETQRATSLQPLETALCSHLQASVANAYLTSQSSTAGRPRRTPGRTAPQPAVPSPRGAPRWGGRPPGCGAS